jgi:hypothetical protein
VRPPSSQVFHCAAFSLQQLLLLAAEGPAHHEGSRSALGRSARSSETRSIGSWTKNRVRTPKLKTHPKISVRLGLRNAQYYGVCNSAAAAWISSSCRGLRWTSFCRSQQLAQRVSQVCVLALLCFGAITLAVAAAAAICGAAAMTYVLCCFSNQLLLHK